MRNEVFPDVGGTLSPPRSPSFGLMAYLSEYSHSYIEITGFFQLDLSIELI
jgi:hypothetical protein